MCVEKLDLCTRTRLYPKPVLTTGSQLQCRSATIHCCFYYNFGKHSDVCLALSIDKTLVQTELTSVQQTSLMYYQQPLLTPSSSRHFLPPSSPHSPPCSRHHSCTTSSCPSIPACSPTQQPVLTSYQLTTTQ